MTTLKKNFEFKRVMNRGKCINGNFIAIYFFPNKLKILRVGFAVSKKAGKAHERNRIKRVIRENVRLLEKEFKKGFDVVFTWKNKISSNDVDFYKIKEELICSNNKFLQSDKNEKNNFKTN